MLSRASLSLEKKLAAQPTLENVGIVGVPPLGMIKLLEERNAAILDLDALLTRADIETATAYLPKVYCAILRTVALNALHLNLDAIVIDVGQGKCDAAFHAARVLEDTIDIPIFRTENHDTLEFGYPVCRTEMNLVEKFERITRSVQSSKNYSDLPKPCKPTAGFWGVPPRDFSLLALFPETTHIYGWTRCMENKTPANSQLEEHFNPDIPTVFFAQSFCAKTALARHLAKIHPQGLYLDVDVTAGSSAKAKVQAFLELTGAMT